MTYEKSQETKDRLAGIREQGKQLGRDGKAFVIDPERKGRNNVLYWDEETGQWLYGNDATEMGWVMFPTDDFPAGCVLAVSWGRYAERSVEETKLYHGTYGLDLAREGYGVNRS